MEKITKTLERKNVCYRSFFKICEDFLAQISKGNSDGIENFQKQREGLLNVLEKLETEIQNELESMRLNGSLESALTPDVKLSIRNLMNEKDGLLKQILDLDHQILLHINRLKDETIQKLQSIQFGKKTVGAYRSPADNVDYTEGLKRVDQEA